MLPFHFVLALFNKQTQKAMWATPSTKETKPSLRFPPPALGKSIALVAPSHTSGIEAEAGGQFNTLTYMH